MLLTVRTASTYELQAETFMDLMVESPLVGLGHRAQEERRLTAPTTFCELRHDHYGNPRRDLVAGQGTFPLEFTATIDVTANAAVPEAAIKHLPRNIPPDEMIYTLPSRNCQSELLARMAQGEFGHLKPGGGRVRAIADWVRKHVQYSHGTTSKTSAVDTATERIGICRDFAQLVIAFCRDLDIPARYLSGYALGLEPPDFHGFVQVYLSGAWHNVDATSEDVRPALVPIAVGRVAADVAMTTLWGPNALIEQTVQVREVPSGIVANC
jgi:transglutaminase-like putative cysteine protease